MTRDSAPDARRVGAWAGRLMPPGPVMPERAAQGVVAELRSAAERARPLAERSSRLGSALQAARVDGEVAEVEVLVVDRPGWAHAAAQSMVALAGPALQGGVAGTAQLAGALGVLGTRVLGQFDPYVAPRLVVVAPNVVEIGTQMGADLGEFALWVCVHEQTHALQFAAAPWLADHLRVQVRGLMEGLARADQLEGVVSAAVGALRGGPPLEGMLDDEGRDRLERITAVMSLLEGHADVSMDGVPTAAIPSKRRLRAATSARRRVGGWHRVLRRVLGLEAKLLQYETGAQFVRAVRRAAPDALDVVWSQAAALPGPEEIADPAAWLRRTRP